MWQYEKKLQYPVNIKDPDPALARIIISQLGGPDGELAASMRYLSQRYGAPTREVQAMLSDIGTEELSHLEMIGTILYQLTRGLSMKEISIMVGYSDPNYFSRIFKKNVGVTPTEFKGGKN